MNPFDNVMKLVNKQAEDEGLWFITQTVGEAYLQKELRKLHYSIEMADKEAEKPMNNNPTELLDKALEIAWYGCNNDGVFDRDYMEQIFNLVAQHYAIKVREAIVDIKPHNHCITRFAALKATEEIFK